MSEEHDEYEPKAAEGETKREAFVRLVNFRLEKTVKRIRQIGNLSNRNNYEYTPEDIDFLRNALLLEVEETMSRFEERQGADIPQLEL